MTPVNKCVENRMPPAPEVPDEKGHEHGRGEWHAEEIYQVGVNYEADKGNEDPDEPFPVRPLDGESLLPGSATILLPAAVPPGARWSRGNKEGCGEAGAPPCLPLFLWPRKEQQARRRQGTGRWRCPRTSGSSCWPRTYFLSPSASSLYMAVIFRDIGLALVMADGNGDEALLLHLRLHLREFRDLEPYGLPASS